MDNVKSQGVTLLLPKSGPMHAFHRPRPAKTLFGALPDTSLHAYGQGREEDIEGDPEKLESGDPQTSQRREISEGDDPGVDPPEKH